VSRFLRFEQGEISYLSPEEIEPFVLKAMKKYERRLQPDYGRDLLSPEEATEVALKEQHIVLIEDDYLLGFTFGSEFFSKGKVIQEAFLMRIGTGHSSLLTVLSSIKVLKTIYKVAHCYVGTRAATNQSALRRLYRRYGGQELLTVMRF